VKEVEEALRAIAHGRVQKVVLARSEELEVVGGGEWRPAAVAARLALRQPDAHTFVIPTGPRSAYVGCTPELLAEVRGGQLRTHALAGTATSRGADRLMDSSKDQHEHRLVVEAMARGLTPLCESLDVAPTPQLRPAGSVVHLETPIRGRLLAGIGLLDVAAALHPTPALAGWPVQTARAWLRPKTTFPGSLYRGLVGELRPGGDGELYAAIRLAHVAPRRARLWAGAGIVEGSTPEAEWEETEWKLRTLRTVLEDAAA
jgi:isochorismate synthase